jgi:hypothetical protein
MAFRTIERQFLPNAAAIDKLQPGINVNRTRTTLVVLAIAAWMCRALIPPGFMPETSDHFSVALKICPGHALQHAPATQKGVPLQPHQAPVSDQPCVYSAGVASAPPSWTVAPSTHNDSLRLSVALHRSAETGRIVTRAQWARGPPVLI